MVDELAEPGAPAPSAEDAARCVNSRAVSQSRAPARGAGDRAAAMASTHADLERGHRPLAAGAAHHRVDARRARLPAMNGRRDRRTSAAGAAQQRRRRQRSGRYSAVVDLRLEIRDDGVERRDPRLRPGFGEAAPLLPGTLFRTSKPGGLGIGLALSHATVERLGGALSMEAAGRRTGVQVMFRLPGGVR